MRMNSLNFVEKHNDSNHSSYYTILEGGRNKTEPKYRNDENVLETLPAQYRQISVDVNNTPPKMVRNVIFL